MTTRKSLQRYQRSEGVYNLSMLDNPTFPDLYKGAYDM